MTAPKPFYAVWELTLACNLHCKLCGSRAGRKRDNELTTEEALRVVEQLARLGIEELTLIGGEAYLKPDWDDILAAMRSHGIRTSITTGGRGFTLERAYRAKAAGVTSVSVSIDGLEAAHDFQRGVPGSFRWAMEALDHAKAAGIRVCSNTQVNRVSFGDLDGLCDALLAKGIEAWQIQLTAPMGSAADHAEMLLQPYDILEVIPKIAELRDRCDAAGVSLQPGNSVGYYGPHETKIRTSTGAGPAHWEGCGAGCTTVGIESDGTFKGCPSLPKAFAAGNVREQPVELIWKTSPVLAKQRATSRKDLWGYCATCYYGDVCKAGCTFTAYTLFGRAGNMPYCWHRADDLRRRGIRETLTPVGKAPGRPFDHGLFRLAEEPWREDEPLASRRNRLLEVNR